MRLLLWFIVFSAFSILAQNTMQHDPLVDPLGHYPTFANAVEIISLSDSTTSTGTYLPSQRIVDLNASQQLEGSSPYVCGSGQQVMNINHWYDCIAGDFDGDGFDEILSAWVSPNGSLRMEMSSASRLKSTYDWQFTQRLFAGDSSWTCDGPIRLLAVNLDSTARKEIVVCIPHGQSLRINNYYFDVNDKTLHAGKTTVVPSGSPYDITSGFTIGGIDGLILVYRGSLGASMRIAKYDYDYTNKSFSLHFNYSDSVVTTDAQWSTWKNLKITTGYFLDTTRDEAVISYTQTAGDSGRQAFSYIKVMGGLPMSPTLPGIIPTGETWGHGYESDAVAADLNPAKKDGDELIVAGPGEIAVLKFDATGKPSYCGTAKTPFIYKGVLETYPRRHFLAVENMDSDTSSATWGKEIIVAEHKPDSTTVFRVLTPNIDNTTNYITGITQRTLLNSTFKSRRSEIAVGDFDGDAIKIWKPTLVTKTSVIQPIVELNMPPTHFDYLNDSLYNICNMIQGDTSSFKVSYVEQQSQSTHFSSELEQGWGVSAELSGGFSLLGASVKASVKTSYDNGYYGSHSQDTTVTVTHGTSSTGDDWILGTVTNYDFWEYPLTALGKRFGYILVQVPHFKGTLWLPSLDSKAQNWMADHEVGNLLSYPQSDTLQTRIGTNLNMKFDSQIISTSSQSNWAIDLSKQTTESSKLTKKIGVEVGASIDGWGIEASVTGNYSKNEIITHTSTASKNVSIGIYLSSLNPKNADANYSVTPFIYWGENGAMVVDYAIEPSGTFWNKHYSAYSDPGFILPWRLDSLKGIFGNEDLKLQSKSIHISPVTPAAGDTALITAIVHNFSLKNTPGPVAVRFYIGNPLSGGTPIVGIKGETVISTSGVIYPQNYATVQMDWKVPPGLNNTSNLYAVIDPSNTIAEIHKDNNMGFIPFTLLGTTGIANEPKNIFPASYKLEQNYPNPFNPTTTVKYHIPKTSIVTIKLFDALGREVRTFVNEVKPAGNYEVTFNCKNLPSGVYFYRMISGDFMQSKKLILLK